MINGETIQTHFCLAPCQPGVDSLFRDLQSLLQVGFPQPYAQRLLLMRLEGNLQGYNNSEGTDANDQT